MRRVSARGDGGSASRLDRPLEVPHPRVAAAALLQQHASVKNKTKITKAEQVLPAGRRPYVKHAVHVGLGDVSQLLGQPGLHGTPLHFVAASEEVQQQSAVLHTRHMFQV